MGGCKVANWSNKSPFSEEDMPDWSGWIKNYEEYLNNKSIDLDTWNNGFEIPKEDKSNISGWIKNYEKWVMDESERLNNFNKSFVIPDEIKEPDLNIFIDEEGNEIPLTNRSSDKQDNVVVEVPPGQLNQANKDSKQGSISLETSVKANITSTKTSEDRETDWFEGKLQSLCSILPKKHREEFLGDLNEIRNSMKVVGHEKWWINLVSILKFIPLIKATLEIKLSDFLDPEQKTKEK